MVRVGYPEAGVAWEAATAPSRPNIELISDIGAILGARGATRAASTGAKSAVHTRFGCLKVDTEMLLLGLVPRAAIDEAVRLYGTRTSSNCPRII